MQLSLQLSKLKGTASYFDENVGRVGIKSDTVRQKPTAETFSDTPLPGRVFSLCETQKQLTSTINNNKSIATQKAWHFVILSVAIISHINYLGC